MMKNVVSSNIDQIGFEVKSRTLVVKFKSNAIYSYANVPYSVLFDFEAAKSKGSYFSANIKGKYTTAPITESDVKALFASERKPKRMSARKVAHLLAIPGVFAFV